MWYVEVLVGDASYHKNEALTYASDRDLVIGSIVLVPLQHKIVLGVVVKTVQKPHFLTKEILGAPTLPPMPTQLMELLAWMREYYPAPLGLTVQLLLPSHLPKHRLTLDPQIEPNTKALPALTADQQSALASISSSGLHVLHGETGSGKTRVYVELAKRNFLAGKSSIILTPEIGLTPQLVDGFKTTFRDRVVVVHSGLTETQRQQTWQLLLEQTEPVIVIGARSALFSPLGNIGLIVVDEAHETAYKQDQAPYYHATTVAAKLAALHAATLVLGSATPLVRDYYLAQAKNRPIVRMTQIAAQSTQKESQKIVIVDLKDRKQFEKSSFLSTTLINSIQATLDKQEQVLLFLNRRGTARVILCEQCAWQAICPHCDLPVVYHGDQHIMRCHSCNYKTAAPTSCVQCGSANIVFRSVGTKAIAEEAKRLFPGTSILRFDTDNKKTERLDAQYDKVLTGGVDIIVGTQSLAKGLDLPKLGLVGVIIADTSLYFPDFSAQERTYQLITQVLGRIGRGHRDGVAIVQTYSADSPILKAIATKDWSSFYDNELRERQKFLFPPFCYLLKISCKRASAYSAQKAAETMAATIRSQKHNVIVEGPVPSFHGKIKNKFVWQIIIKAKNRQYLTAIIKSLPSGWSYDIDPMNLL